MPQEIQENLRTLLTNRHPFIVAETVEEDRLLRFIQDGCADLVRPLFDWSRADGLRRITPTGSVRNITQTLLPATALRHVEDLSVPAVCVFKDLGPMLEDPEVTRQLRETVTHLHQIGGAVVLIGNPIKIPAELEPAVTRFTLDRPKESEMSLLLDQSIKQMRNRGHEFEVALDATDRQEVVQALQGLTETEAEQQLASAALTDGRLCGEDAARILAQKAAKLKESNLLDYFPVDEQTAELGGFAKLKAWLERSAVGFSSEAAALNLPAPRGILLVGVQGCGKSLSAKIVARLWQLPLVKLEAGRLYDKYVGESERNFREAIAQVEAVAPCVLWIDEIEKALATGDNDGGTSKRLLGSFLTWLQEKHQSVFVVGTANDLTTLPPELLRKGRFDEIFFVDLPNPSERASILDIHLRRRKQDPDALDMAALVAATNGFSGAEIEQVIISALYRSLHHRYPCDSKLLLHEIQETVPLSVSRRESIEELRHEGRTRFVGVS